MLSGAIPLSHTLPTSPPAPCPAHTLPIPYLICYGMCYMRLSRQGISALPAGSLLPWIVYATRHVGTTLRAMDQGSIGLGVRLLVLAWLCDDLAGSVIRLEQAHQPQQAKLRFLYMAIYFSISSLTFSSATSHCFPASLRGGISVAHCLWPIVDIRTRGTQLAA